MKKNGLIVLSKGKDIKTVAAMVTCCKGSPSTAK